MSAVFLASCKEIEAMSRVQLQGPALPLKAPICVRIMVSDAARSDTCAVIDVNGGL
jgi:hypothetical protein